MLVTIVCANCGATQPRLVPMARAVDRSPSMDAVRVAIGRPILPETSGWIEPVEKIEKGTCTQIIQDSASVTVPRLAGRSVASVNARSRARWCHVGVVHAIDHQAELLHSTAIGRFAHIAPEVGVVHIGIENDLMP